MAFDIIDVAKIAITVGSVITLLLFRKSIMNVINGLISEEKSEQRTERQIIADINSKLDYLTGKR